MYSTTRFSNATHIVVCVYQRDYSVIRVKMSFIKDYVDIVVKNELRKYQSTLKTNCIVFDNKGYHNNFIITTGYH